MVQDFSYPSNLYRGYNYTGRELDVNEQQAVSTTQMMKTPNQVVMLEKQALTNPMLIGFLLEKISVTVMKRRGAASLKVEVQDCHHLCREAPLMSLR